MMIKRRDQRVATLVFAIACLAMSSGSQAANGRRPPLLDALTQEAMIEALEAVNGVKVAAEADSSGSRFVLSPDTTAAADLVEVEITASTLGFFTSSCSPQLLLLGRLTDPKWLPTARCFAAVLNPTLEGTRLKWALLDAHFDQEPWTCANVVGVDSGSATAHGSMELEACVQDSSGQTHLTSVRLSASRELEIGEERIAGACSLDAEPIALRRGSAGGVLEAFFTTERDGGTLPTSRSLVLDVIASGSFSAEWDEELQAPVLTSFDAEALQRFRSSLDANGVQYDLRHVIRSGRNDQPPLVGTSVLIPTTSVPLTRDVLDALVMRASKASQ